MAFEFRGGFSRNGSLTFPGRLELWEVRKGQGEDGAECEIFSIDAQAAATIEKTGFWTQGSAELGKALYQACQPHIVNGYLDIVVCGQIVLAFRSENVFDTADGKLLVLDANARKDEVPTPELAAVWTTLAEEHVKGVDVKPTSDTLPSGDAPTEGVELAVLRRAT